MIVFLGIVLLANAQNDGRYKPPSTPRTPTDGRYRPSGDGRYRGDNDGKYVHKDVKYVHDARDGGQYAGDKNKYQPDKNRTPNALIAGTLAKPSATGKGTAEGGGGWAIIRSEDKMQADGYRYL